MEGSKMTRESKSKPPSRIILILAIPIIGLGILLRFFQSRDNAPVDEPVEANPWSSHMPLLPFRNFAIKLIYFGEALARSFKERKTSTRCHARRDTNFSP